MRSNIHQDDNNEATLLAVDDAQVPSCGERPQALHGALQGMITKRGLSAVLLVKRDRRIYSVNLAVGQTGYGLSDFMSPILSDFMSPIISRMTPFGKHSFGF